MEVTLTGTRTNPALRLRFGRTETLPNGKPALDWVKRLPDRHWDKDARAWIVTGIGPNPGRTLAAAGIHADQLDYAALGVSSIDDVTTPIARSFEPHTALVRPRFLGSVETARLLGFGAVPDEKTGRLVVPVGELVDVSGIEMDDVTLERARAYRTRHVAPTARPLPVLSDATRVDDLPARAPRPRSSFTKTPFGYQQAGAASILFGHRLLADPPGVGKTLTALLALDESPDPQLEDGNARILIVCPPVALTGWRREVEASNTRGCGSGENVTVILPGRKQQPAPDAGFVIVSDSLLASRPQLVDNLIAWGPHRVVVDEVHRLKSRTSDRSRAIMRLLASVPYPAIALSGTPLLSSPADLVGILDMTGHLYPVFGGYHAFLSRYCRPRYIRHKNRPPLLVGWSARMDMLADLRSKLDGYVWVRRPKESILELPPKHRYPVYVDVPLTLFRKAHVKITEKVDEWLDGLSHIPDADEISTWAREHTSGVSQLREAAGLAKIPAAVEYVADWLESNPPDSHGIYPRPLLVWAHHIKVQEELADSVERAVPNARRLLASTPQEVRDAAIDDFQSGKVPVIVASIQAAGVAITLTRGHDSLFVETDWTPGLIQQAEDRQQRIGQTADSIDIVVMIAPGTLDERIQAVQDQKGRVLDPLLGRGQNVAVADGGGMSASDVIAEIVQSRLSSRRGSFRPAA